MKKNHFVDHLARIVSPPEVPDLPQSNTLNCEILGFEIGLPNDFISFMRSFGPGWFFDEIGELRIYDVSAKSNVKELHMSLEYNQHLFLSYPEFRYPSCPELPGLIPWGNSVEGQSFFWLAKDLSLPNTWTTVIDSRSSAGVVEYPVGMAEYLYNKAIGIEPIPALAEFLDNLGQMRYVPLSKSPFGRLLSPEPEE
jgi:hypothetical protein